MPNNKAADEILYNQLNSGIYTKVINNMKAEFTTTIPNDKVEANLLHLCGPDERFEIEKCIVNWQVSPVLKQWGIWSFQQTVKSVELIVGIFPEYGATPSDTKVIKVSDTDGYNIDFEIKGYDGKADFTINELELDPIKKYIKAII